MPNATQPPLFLARFSPKFRPFSAIFRPFSPSRRQEAGQRKGTAENGRKTAEKRPRNSGLGGVGIPLFFLLSSSPVLCQKLNNYQKDLKNFPSPPTCIRTVFGRVVINSVFYRLFTRILSDFRPFSASGLKSRRKRKNRENSPGENGGN